MRLMYFAKFNLIVSNLKDVMHNSTLLWLIDVLYVFTIQMDDSKLAFPLLSSSTRMHLLFFLAQLELIAEIHLQQLVRQYRTIFILNL